MTEFRIKKEERQALLNYLARHIEENIPDGFGFALLIFSWGEGGELHWVSNAERQCMLEAMQEFVQKEAN